jgi:hypothetical protein
MTDIRTHPATKEYRKNWDEVFNKGKKEIKSVPVIRVSEEADFVNCVECRVKEVTVPYTTTEPRYEDFLCPECKEKKEKKDEKR